MTDEIKNPQAFPTTERFLDGSHYANHLGMTLRDYFAGQALAGMFANPEFDEVSAVAKAMEAFNAADEMLAQR
jgi:small ligand-binding sensory domain FIST